MTPAHSFGPGASGFGHGVIPARGPCDTWIKLLNPEIVLADDVSRTCA